MNAQVVKISPWFQPFQTSSSEIDSLQPEFGIMSFMSKHNSYSSNSTSHSPFCGGCWNTDRDLLLSLHADYIQCPYCMRRFNETAAQRHINFCKDQSSRRVFDPAQTAAKLASRAQVTLSPRVLALVCLHAWSGQVELAKEPQLFTKKHKAKRTDPGNWLLGGDWFPANIFTHTKSLNWSMLGWRYEYKDNVFEALWRNSLSSDGCHPLLPRAESQICSESQGKCPTGSVFCWGEVQSSGLKATQSAS